MADKSGINILHYYKQKLKSFFLSKDILSFLLFVALSAAFWFVHALGKERETIISVPIRYIGVPMNVAITNSPPSAIQLTIKDQGLRLFDYSKKRLTPLTIDLSRIFYQKGDILITSDQLTGRINRYMHMQPTTTVLEVHPDSILVQYQKLSIKKLPIELVSDIEFSPQYMLSNKIRLEPNVVTVFGPKYLLDSMKCIRTESLKLDDVNDTLDLRCKLKPEKGLRYSANDIKVSIFVEPFTERKVLIPIISINCPKNISIRTFPAFVNVTYTVGLSQFNILNPNDIKVFLDYNDLKTNKLSKQKLKVKNNSARIANIRITPQEVEFIIEQK